MIPSFLKDKYANICQDYYANLRKECTVCNNSGILMTSDTTFKDCECTKRFIKNKEYIKCGIPISLFNKNRMKFKETFTEECQDKFKKLIAMLRVVNISANILIHSHETKDYAAMLLSGLIGINMIDNEKDVLFIKSCDLMERFFDFDNNADDIDTITSTKYLIIDGLGNESQKQLNDDSSFVFTKFTNLLSNRNNLGCYTIFSTDLTLEELKTKYHKNLVEFFILRCLKFAAITAKKKLNALDELKNIHPEFMDIFSDAKVTSFAGETVKQKRQLSNRGKSLI